MAIVKLEEDGTILVPLELLKEAKIKPGPVYIYLENNYLVITPAEKILEDIQNEFDDFDFTSDDFLKSKKDDEDF